MKCELGDAVQWLDVDGGWQVGKIVCCGLAIVTAKNGIEYSGPPQKWQSILVAHSHTRELEFVEFSKLSPYPSSPIPQPEGK